MSVKTRDLGMTPLDDLFSTDESRAESQLEKVVTLNPAEISDFPNHPFKVKQDEAMAEMVESVRKYGVLVPALVRPKADGGYEMVAGHRRKFAAALAELSEIPCIVRDLTDDEATIIMVDSNLQRETILPSEKAFAYKMKLDAMKRQAGRPSRDNLRPLDTDLIGTRSDEQLAKDSPDSARQIQRYIRLTELIPSILQMVDDGKIAFRPAVELSYLSTKQQEALYSTMECEDCTPSLAQAIKMKEFSKDDKLTEEVILSIIQITLAARLEKFNLTSLAALTATDELDLPSLGEKKVALFALIPDNDTSFNFLVSILYTQLFQQLFYLADHKYGGSLPVPVHFLMDEFSNVSLPEDFSKILAVMRSRNVFVSIILQNIAALKALFEKEWESILGNCDEFLYLGGNETSTHKLISESYLGKATINTNTYGKSSGRNGNYSTNYQISGRELMTPDEVRMLDNRYALLFIRGERPVMDEKYDILKHPNIALTEDGGAPPYEHGGTEHAIATLSLAGIPAEDIPDMEETEPDYELLSDEDIEALFSI